MCTRYTFLQRIYYSYLNDMFALIRNLFYMRNASYNMSSCKKLILFIGNSDAKPYYSELHLNEIKVRLVLSSIVITLDHMMLTP